MADSPIGKRAANRERIRGDLAAAAIRLFEEYGFDEVTVDEVAEAAGVSRRTLFRHFATKSDIVFADHPERIRRLEAYLSAASPFVSPVDVVIGAAEATIQSFADPADFFLARHRLLKITPELRFREQAYGLKYTQVLSRYLRRRFLDSNVPVDDIDVLSDTLGAGVVTVVNRAQRTWAASGGEIDPKVATSAGLRVLRRAFGPIIDGPAATAADAPTVTDEYAVGGAPSEVVERLNTIFG
jgi:AcrR family transcriptional regulator